MRRASDELCLSHVFLYCSERGYSFVECSIAAYRLWVENNDRSARPIYTMGMMFCAAIVTCRCAWLRLRCEPKAVPDEDCWFWVDGILKLALPTEVLTFPNCTKLVTLYRSPSRFAASSIR